MGLGDFFSQLAREAVTDAISEAAERGLANRANRRKPGEPAPTFVQYGRATRIVTAVTCALLGSILAFMAIAVAGAEPLKDALILTPFFGAIAIGMSIAGYDTFVRRVDWDDRKVRFRSWNRDRDILWTDITSLKNIPYQRSWRVGFRDGTGFGISETMPGSRYFLSRVDRRLTPASLRNWPGSKRRKRRQRSKKR